MGDIARRRPRCDGGAGGATASPQTITGLTEPLHLGRWWTEMNFVRPAGYAQSAPHCEHPGDDIAKDRKDRRAGVWASDSVHCAGSAGRKAMASISIFAFSNRPATCTAVLVGGSFGKNSPRIRENTA